MEKGAGGEIPPGKAPQSVTPLIFPPKKLARQLDFSGSAAASAATAAAALVLPEHPQKPAVRPIQQPQAAVARLMQPALLPSAPQPSSLQPLPKLLLPVLSQSSLSSKARIPKTLG